MFKTFMEAKRFIEDNKIHMVDFMMIDIDGRWRHLTIPADRFEEDILKSGIGFDGSNYGFAPVEKSDMVFIPDLTTAYVDRFSEVSTVTMIGDVYVIEYPKNKPFDQDPRNVAKHAEEYMLSTGIADEFRIGPEFEFHVFDHVSYSVDPNRSGFHLDTGQAEWNKGKDDEVNLAYKIAHKGGYHIASPQDVLYDFRSRVCTIMEEHGIRVKYHHHEVGGPGQMEVEVEFGGLREMADKTMMTKYIVKNQAIKENRRPPLCLSRFTTKRVTACTFTCTCLKRRTHLLRQGWIFSVVQRSAMVYRRSSQTYWRHLRLHKSQHQLL